MAASKRARHDDEARGCRDVRPRSLHSSSVEIPRHHHHHPQKGLDDCYSKWWPMPPPSRSGGEDDVDEIETLCRRQGLSRNHFQNRQPPLRPWLGRNGDRNYDRNGDRNFDRNGDRSADRDMDRNFDRIGDRRFNRSGSRSVDRDCDRNGDRVIDENFDRNCNRGLERNGNRNFDRNMNRNVGRNFDRNFGRDGGKNIDRNIDRNFDRDVSRNIDRNFNRDCDRNIGRTIDRKFGRDGGRNIDGNFDREGDRGFDRNAGRNTEGRVRLRQQWQRDGAPRRYLQQRPWIALTERSRPRVCRQGDEHLYDNSGDPSCFPPVDSALIGGGNERKGEDEEVLRDMKSIQLSHSYAAELANVKVLPSAFLAATEISPRVSDGNPSKLDREVDGENVDRDDNHGVDDDDDGDDDDDYDDDDDDEELCDYSEVEDEIEERAREWSSLPHTLRTSSCSSSSSNGSNDGGGSSVLTTEQDCGNQWQEFLRAIEDGNCPVPQASKLSDGIYKMPVISRDSIGEGSVALPGGFDQHEAVLLEGEQKALPSSIGGGSAVLQDRGPWDLLSGIIRSEAVLQEGDLRVVPPCSIEGGSTDVSLLDRGSVVLQDKATSGNDACCMEPPCGIKGVDGNTGLQGGAFVQPLVREECSADRQCVWGVVGVASNQGVHRSWSNLGLTEGQLEVEPEGDKYGKQETIFKGGWEVVPQQDTTGIDHKSNDMYIGSNGNNYIGPIEDRRGSPRGGCEPTLVEGGYNDSIGSSECRRALPLGLQKAAPLEDGNGNGNKNYNIGSTNNWIGDNCSRVVVLPREGGLEPSPPLEGTVNNIIAMCPNGSELGQEQGGSQEDGHHSQSKHVVVWSKACALAWLFLNPA